MRHIKQPPTPNHLRADHSIARGYGDSGNGQSSLVFLARLEPRESLHGKRPVNPHQSDFEFPNREDPRKFFFHPILPDPSPTSRQNTRSQKKETDGIAENARIQG